MRRWLWLGCVGLACHEPKGGSAEPAPAADIVGASSAPSVSTETKHVCPEQLPASLSKPLSFTTCLSKPPQPEYPECTIYQLDPKSTPGCAPSRIELVMSGHGLLEGHAVDISPEKLVVELRLAEDGTVRGRRRKRGDSLGALDLEEGRVKRFRPSSALQPYVPGEAIAVDD